MDPSGSEDFVHWRDNELKLWPTLSNQSQPYLATTANGQLLEIPFNGTMVDYHAQADIASFFGLDGVPAPDDTSTMQSMLAVYHACRDRKLSRMTNTTMTFGFHQESAPDYLDALSHFLSLLQTQAKDDNVTIQYVTTADIPMP
jgi:hypothetical protein